MKLIINRLNLFFTVLLSILVFSGCTTKDNRGNGSGRAENFNVGWKFFRGEVENAQASAFDDSGWREIDLPHDYSIEDLPDSPGKKQIGPFTEESEGGPSTGHVKGGTGWYRKHFITAREDRGKRISILFDGIYRNATVWINGTALGDHPYGYTAFWYDLTPFLNPPGEQNILAVQVRNEGKNSRWYSGSGIYRDVWLVKTGSVFIAPWSVFVTTPFVSEDSAVVNIVTSVGNESVNRAALRAVASLIDPAGKVAGQVTIKTESYPGESAKLHFKLPVRKPVLWNIDTPELYTAVIKLEADGKSTDQEKIKFGIRKTEFSAREGFLLNGKSILLKGGCMHHDNGSLGSAAFDAAEYRRVRIMKENGFNAIRTSHNPPSSAFLDACDRLGMLVIDEAFDQWQRPKNEKDYSGFFNQWWEKDIESMVLRDRNHPSVIIWSIGNEINERADSSGLAIARNLKKKIRELDSTRPVTQAICDFWDHKNRKWDETAPAFEQMDVHGYNYQWQKYLTDHEKYPGRIVIGTESFPMEAYENWQLVEEHPWVIGDFVWTGMDYLGESGIGHTKMNDSDWGFLPPWPWYNAYCGDISILGYKKPQMFFRDVVWRNSDLEMLVHEPVPAGKTEVVSKWGWPAEWKSWNWKGSEGRLLEVSVYTRCQEVRLELNGKVIGTNALSEEAKLKTIFKVPYEPGELVAVGLKEGREVVRQILKTTGDPVSIKIVAEKDTVSADRNDLAYLNIEIADAEKNLVPDAAVPVHLKIEGNGELMAVGNGNPTDMRSFQKPEITTFHGKCQVILRPFLSKGKIKLTANAENIQGAETEVFVQ